MGSFFLCAVIYPEFLKQAQAEMDEVVGNDRLPNFGDKGSLPFIDCVVLEVLRWTVVTPLGA